MFPPQAISLAAITNTAVCFSNLYPDLFHPMLTELQGFFFPSFYLMQASKYALMTHLEAVVICFCIFCFVFFPQSLVFGFIDLQ